MKYTIKPEYLDLWEGGESPSDPERVITEEDIDRLSRDWDMTPDELREQLTPIEP